jgi:hypothetical protein
LHTTYKISVLLIPTTGTLCPKWKNGHLTNNIRKMRIYLYLLILMFFSFIGIKSITTEEPRQDVLSYQLSYTSSVDNVTHDYAFMQMHIQQLARPAPIITNSDIRKVSNMQCYVDIIPITGIILNKVYIKDKIPALNSPYVFRCDHIIPYARGHTCLSDTYNVLFNNNRYG